MNEIVLVNITWNPSGWRNNTYINPKAGHNYAKSNVGGESLNFNFNKKTIDNDKIVQGYVQWTNKPVKYKNGGLIIFYTRNTDINKGQIVGIYGKAEIFEEVETHKVTFQKTDYWTNINGEKEFSLLFPIPLFSDDYKEKSSDRIVGQTGFTYKDKSFAENILFDELTELSKSGSNETDFKKLLKVYEYYIGKKFVNTFVSIDEKEQKEIVKFYQKNKSKEEIVIELNNLEPSEPETIIVNHKTYKRDNKTIALIKILRDFKCQICSTSILKKNGEKYVEGAHIKPKHQKGAETPDNIILLCPNHHKEFDIGKLEIIKHDKEKIEFELNNKNYKIKLSIS